MEDWTLSICEVHYEDWKPVAYSEAQVTYYTDKENLNHEFDLMFQAFDRPILNVKDIWKKHS